MFAARKNAYGSVSNPNSKKYVDDVFATYIYVGSSSAITINNGIDLAGKGGLVWIKNRSQITHHSLCDTVRGVTHSLSSSANVAQDGAALAIASVTSSGFTVPSGAADVNNNGDQFVSWSFAESPKFFKQLTVTHTNGVADTVDLSSLGTVGMVVVKQYDNTGSWFTWHRSQTPGKLTFLNQTDAEVTDGRVSVSGTTLTLGSTLPSGNYTIYAWAHDPSSDGIIQCGSFTYNGSGNASVTLGWEPQFIIEKTLDATTGFWMEDIMRGMPVDSGIPGSNVSGFLAEAGSYAAEGPVNTLVPTATGFKAQNRSSPFNNKTSIYLAIRRSNKPPASGNSVYNAIARSGSGSAATVTSVGFTFDLVMSSTRVPNGAGIQRAFFDRLRGNNKVLKPNFTVSDAYVTDAITSYTMNGMTLSSADTSQLVNTNPATYIYHFFKRAPGLFDQVCYTGTGAANTVAHNLGVAPEMMIVKNRSNTVETSWAVYHSAIGANKGIQFESPGVASLNSGDWNNTAPTASVFSVGTASESNYNGGPMVAYLFATLPGISKVGGYTGNGGSQTIDCGFTAGARFILIKRTDASGDWFVWDSVRGITSGADPYIMLNSPVQEVTPYNAIDPAASGFIVNQTPIPGINVSGGNYIFLAIA